MTLRLLKKTLQGGLIAFAVSAAALAQENSSPVDQYPDVRILESTDNGMTMEFKPKYLPGQNIVVDQNDYQIVRIERGSSWDYADAGKPDVRFRTVAVGLPGMTNNRVSIVAADYETVNSFSLAPVPTLGSSSHENPDGRLYRRSPSSRNEFYPASTVTMNSVAMVKGVPVGYLRIFPVQYNSLAKTLRKYSRIVIRVDFGARERIAASKDDDWMRVSLLNYPVAKRFLPRVASPAKRALVNSVLSTGNWYKLEVREDGMYKIDAAYLRTLGIDRSSLGIRDLKVYGNNGLALPANLRQSRPADLTQHAAFYVDTNLNGKFDEDDYILFYGQGVTGWTYSSDVKDFAHYTNPYTNSNFYFLQYAPQAGAVKEMSTVQSPASGVPVSTTLGKFFFDEERTNVTHSGLEWYSAPMNPKDSRVIVNKLNGYIAGTPVRYKYEMLSRADVTAAFSVEESGVQIASLYVAGFDLATLQGDPIYDYANRNQGQVLSFPSLADDRSTVKITYNANSSIATGYINWVEILYTQQLAGIDDAIIFTSPDTTAAVQYALSGFSENKFSVFDITDVADVKIMPLKSDQITGTYLFLDNLSAGTVKRYWAGTTFAYKTPASFVRVPNTNLRGVTSGVDFIIITHRDFLAEAQRLKSFKENLPGGDALKTFVVEVDTIYNEFGGGMPDPVAIRDFLKYATSNWPQASGQPAPSYVLFFGDACFDFKNILGSDKNWVPTYQTPESDYQIDTYGYDDFFAFLTPGNTIAVTLAHGRLPVRTAAEARLEVDRIIKYESAPSFGTWKNLITVVADDRNVDGVLDGAENPEQAENLAQNYIPRLFEVKKIYEEDYPMVISSTGRTRPAARQALLDQVNRGTLVLNFTGHGNPKVWSHESILTKDDVINQFSNGDKLTFIVAATCDWGRYDESGEQSSAEEALVNENGGAIGVVSADRAVYSDDNAATNYVLYSYLFSTNPFSRTVRLGDGLMLAKNDGNSGAASNNHKYHLLGDPTLRLAVPRLVMKIDSINGKPIGSGVFDTLQALGKVTIKASVRDTTAAVKNFDSDSALASVFDAERTAFVFDSDPKVQHSFSFVKPGAIIYTGDNTIRNGRLSATFIVPKDISYENKQGRISIYFSGNAADGRGFTDQVIVGGTASTFANDTQGPTIRIFFDSRSFRSGDVVGDNPQLIVDLADSSGINSAGSSIGHRLEAWLDGNSKSTDLTEFYKGAKDNYQAGSIEYQLVGLAPGRHTLRARAWDVYNNSSTDQVDFIVASSTALALENVYNIPNPVRSTTTFTFQHNQLIGVDVEIKIYTVSGRLIQTISSYDYPNRFVEIPWDCRDRDGAKIGNGTYLYKITARTVDAKFTSEALGKMSMVR